MTSKRQILQSNSFGSLPSFHMLSLVTLHCARGQNLLLQTGSLPSNKPTGVSRGRLKGPHIWRALRKRRSVCSSVCFPSELSHVIKYHGAAECFSQRIVTCRCRQRRGWKVLQVTAVTILWSVTVEDQQVLVWHKYSTIERAAVSKFSKKGWWESQT